MQSDPVNCVVPDILPITASIMQCPNPSFVVDLLGEKLPPAHFLREFLQNSIEAKATTIYFGRDPFYIEKELNKLCLIDNGIGMDQQTMVRMIRDLAVTSKKQGLDANYGIGGKIAAGPRNHCGILYKSWVNGIGHMVLFLRVGDDYALHEWEDNEGQNWIKVENDDKPPQIDQHGTMVTWLGMTVDQDTTRVPPETRGGEAWVILNLNKRYANLTSIGVTIKVDLDKRNFDQQRKRDGHGGNKVTGMIPHLLTLDPPEGSKNADGIVTADPLHGEIPVVGVRGLPDMVFKWFLISTGKKDENGNMKDAPGYGGFYPKGAQVGVIFKNEIYDLTDASTGVNGRLEQAGIFFGHQNVVLYVELTSTPRCPVRPDDSRTRLILNNIDKEFPWRDIMGIFRTVCPAELVFHQESIAAKSEIKAGENHAERLKNLIPLIESQKYTPSKNGDVSADPNTPEDGLTSGSVHNGNGSHGSGTSCGTKTGAVGGTGTQSSKTSKLLAGLTSGGVKASIIRSRKPPYVQWITSADGSREPERLKNLVAQYDYVSNQLFINADYIPISKMFKYVADRVDSNCPKDIVLEKIRYIYESKLVEVVMSVCADKEDGKIDMDTLQNKMLSPEALSVAVRDVSGVLLAAKKSLGKFARF